MISSARIPNSNTSARQPVPLLSLLITALLSIAVPAQTPVVVQPGAPGKPSTTLAAPPAKNVAKYTAADAAFMQGMIHHHAQAIEMVELLKTRTQRKDMKLLGLKIEVSQNDEMKMMRNWLK